MLTVVETPTYAAKAVRILTDDEREAFAAFIARNPDAGRVIRGSGGLRKVRWARRETGRRGGARIIYYSRLSSGEIWLLTIYSKSERSSIPSHELRSIKEAMERG